MVDEVETAKVYDITKAKCKVEGKEMEGIGEDGFGITPESEITIIKGLIGGVGANIDPYDGAEGTLYLASTSPDNKTLMELRNKQATGEKKSVVFEMIVDPDFVEAFGFSSRKIVHAWIVSSPEFKTAGKEAPQYEWKFAGYGYEDNYVTA